MGSNKTFIRVRGEARVYTFSNGAHIIQTTSGNYAISHNMETFTLPSPSVLHTIKEQGVQDRVLGFDYEQDINDPNCKALRA